MVNFAGEIPNEVGNLTSLKTLNLCENNLTGAIPKEAGSLYNVELLYLYKNTLRGSIPAEIFNISALQYVDLSFNNLSGTIPLTMGVKLSNLEELRLNNNDLRGVLPNSISNASNLKLISLNFNGFSGLVPNTLGNLRNLRFIDLSFNRLSSEPSFPELSFMTSLMSCRFLRYLLVIGNPLNGFLPTSISNHSTSLEYFSARSCKIMGNIPNEIGNLSSLLFLDLSHNELIGFVPRTVRGLRHLQGLLLHSNEIRGTLDVFCGLQSLDLVRLSQNQFYGPIPECLGNVTSLSEIHLASNKLDFRIPAILWNMKSLQVLDLSSNLLSGSIPSEIGKLEAVYFLDLSVNQLSGIIPSTIGNLQNLVYLSLANNTLEGCIPELIGNIISLETLNLSHNNLSCVIPKSLEALRYLKNFNVSFNGLSGEISHEGPFKNFTGKSFMYNAALCSGDLGFGVPPCHSNSRKRKRNSLHLGLVFLGLSSIVIAMTLAILVLRSRKKQKVPNGIDLHLVEKYGRFSHNELLQSSDGYNESNLLGMGSFGSVYKGILRDGTLVAIKVFKLQQEGALKSYGIECEVLRNLRHRNLTKVIGYCSNYNFKALVLQYMPNGNLEKWLYSSNHSLDLMKQINIMIDVACALEYLHFGYTTPVVHCDLKPSNILLDEDMVAHVSDFGIAKIFGEGESILHTNTIATLGYIAPEYGSEGLVSIRIDVYSFGIVLMETFSRMKPSDQIFSGDLNLKIWVQNSLPDATQVVDANLIKAEDEHFTNKMECVVLIMKLALNCCRECPGERINMKDVLSELKKIKHHLNP